MKGGLRLVERGRLQGPTPSPAGGAATLSADARSNLKVNGATRTPRLRAQVIIHLLSLADQAVVTGVQFLTVVAIARYASAGALGTYSTAWLLLGTVIAIQNSLITLPYMIQRHSASGTPAECAGAFLMQSCLLSALVAIVLGAGVLVAIADGARPTLAAVGLALALVAPLRLLREFGREFAFAHLRIAQALVLDSAMAAIQLGAIGWLAWAGRMSGVTALLALGLGCAPVSVLAVWLARSDFALRVDRLQTNIRRSWKLGRWLFAGQITVWTQVSVANWALALIVGTKATGVYAACMSIAGFANPIITSFLNTLTPRAVKAFHEGGGAGLRRHAMESSLLLGAVMAGFCVLVAIAGDQVMSLVYHGPEYASQGGVLTLLAVALLISYVGIPASNALASMQRPRTIVVVGSIGAALAAILVPLLTIRWGLVGAAYGFLGGNLAGTLGRWTCFLRAVARLAQCEGQAGNLSKAGLDPEMAAATGVVQQMLQSSDASGWEVARLAEASQASLYSIRVRQAQLLGGSHQTLVVKLYKPEAKRDLKTVRAQYDVLSRLHAAIHGRKWSGWRVSVPEPLYVCEEPLALVMTMVPGQTLTLCLETGDNLTPEVLDSAARAIIAAMQTRWLVGQMHGDLTLDNILCDAHAKSLSFVDADTEVVARGSRADNTAFPRDPRVRDLMSILAYVGLSGNREARQRRHMFTESILRALLETDGAFDNKIRLLDEVAASARARPPGVYPPWPLDWLGRTLRAAIVFRRLGSVIGHLEAELGGSTRR